MDIKPAIFAVLNQDGKIVGTGFLVAPHLAVTCAHVIFDAGAIADDDVQIRFSDQETKTSAVVISELWRDVDQGDIAFLRLNSIPKSVFPLRLAPATGSRSGSSFLSFGYATAADIQGIAVRGTIDDYLPEHKLLQIQAPQANHGISGAPVLDEKRSVVVGMITKGHAELGRNELTTFATPTELLWKVCPEIKPATPPLPRRNPIVEGINLLSYDYDQRIQNFLTEYLGTESHPVPFGGRDEALRKLDSWLAETTPYLLLTAPAGRGKSALLVRWLDSLKAREDLALVFVPVSIRFGTNMERVFYAALAARLAFLHGDDILASPETSTAAYRGLVSNYLSKPLANGQTLLVVLDGLDEAADWQAGANFMPGELPAGVRVVVSARFLAGDADSTSWLRRLNWERNGLASVPSLTPLDQDGVRDVLIKMGCPLDELSRNVDIVAELYRLSEGDPLLVSLYVNDLWGKGERVSRLKPEDLEIIKPGYKSYFDRWWDDQKKLWGKDKPWLERHVRAVRILLAGALGPLFRDDFHALDPELESDYIVDALNVLQRFIIGDNQNQGYTFNHPKLGQYFWDDLNQAEQAQVDNRFLDWGGRTFQEFIDGRRDSKKKAEISAYVVYNFGVHLARANQPIEKYLPLIHHQHWAQVWFMAEGAYDGYSQDVRRVWGECRVLDRQSVEQGGKATYIGQQIRCGLIDASLHSLSESIPIKLIPILVQEKIWTLSQTWAYIRQMTYDEKKSNAIIEMIPYLNDEQLQEALLVARSIKDGEPRTKVLGELAKRLPGLAREALFSACEIRWDWARSEMLRKITQHIPDEALKQIQFIAQEIQNKIDRASFLTALAFRMPEMTREALETAHAIKNEETLATMLISLAQRSPEDDLRQILEIARLIQGPNSRSKVLCQLTQRLPEIAGEALISAEMIPEEEFRANVLSQLAQYSPEGNLGQILEVARLIQVAYYRAEVLSQLAQRLPEIALEALKAARAIPVVHRALILSNLTPLLPEVAIETVDAAASAGVGFDLEDSLLRIVHRVPKSALGEVAQVAKRMTTQNYQVGYANVLIQIARRLPDRVKEAFDATLAVKSDEDLMRLLLEIEKYLPDEAMEQVLETAQSIEDEKHRAPVLCVVARRFREEKLEEVLKAGRALRDKHARISVLIEIAQRMPGVAKEVLEVSLAIEDKTDWSSALSATYNRKHKDVLFATTKFLPETVLRKVLETEQAEELLVLVQDLVRKFRSNGYETRILIDLVENLPAQKIKWLLAYLKTYHFPDGLSERKVLIALARRMPEDELGQMLEVTKSVILPENRVELLCEITQRLPINEIGKVVDIARDLAIKGDTEVLIQVAQRLPEEELKQVLIIARMISDKRKRAEVLSLLAQRLPSVIREALEMALEITDKTYRAIALELLVQQIPEVTGEAFKASLASINRDQALEKLVQTMLKIPVKYCYEALEVSLPELSKSTRAKLFSDLVILMPAIVYAGTDNTLHEIHEAVRDVAIWWP